MARFSLGDRRQRWPWWWVKLSFGWGASAGLSGGPFAFGAIAGAPLEKFRTFWKPWLDVVYEDMESHGPNRRAEIVN
jgi:hypothetical protein